MNYLDIVLMGYKTTSDFPQHIYREYKKAIENHYSLKEFFDGCNNAVAHMASLIDNLYFRHIERLNSLIDVIENDINRSEEQKAIDIEKVNTEIELVDKNNFGTPLLFLTNNRLTGHLHYNDIGLMMHGLQDALVLVTKDKVEQSISTPKNISIEFREVYEEEVTEERKAALKAELDNIEGIPEKIKFLEIKKLDYLQNIPSRSFEVSGRTIGSGFQSGPLLFDRFIELEIEKLKIELNSTNTNFNFESIFNPKSNAYNVCIELLEDLEITVNGECRLTVGKAGPLIGAIAAMKLTPNFFKQDFTDMELLNYFNRHLSTNFKTFARRGILYDNSFDDSQTFIELRFKK